MVKQFLKRLAPKKVMTCSNCGARFRFPVKAGKVLDVTCPKCGAKFRVSFENPITGLLTGKMKWAQIPKSEQMKLGILIFTFIISIIFIFKSFNQSTERIQSNGQEIINAL